MSVPRNSKTTYSITSTIKTASSTLCAQQAWNWRRGGLTRDPHLNTAVGDAVRWAETCHGEEGMQPLRIITIWWLNAQTITEELWFCLLNMHPLYFHFTAGQVCLRITS